MKVSLVKMIEKQDFDIFKNRIDEKLNFLISQLGFDLCISSFCRIKLKLEELKHLSYLYVALPKVKLHLKKILTATQFNE